MDVVDALPLKQQAVTSGDATDAEVDPTLTGMERAWASVRNALDGVVKVRNTDEVEQPFEGGADIGIGVGQGYHSAGAKGYDGLVRLTPDGKLHLHMLGGLMHLDYNEQYRNLQFR